MKVHCWMTVARKVGTMYFMKSMSNARSKKHVVEQNISRSKVKQVELHCSWATSLTRGTLIKAS